MTAYSKDFKRDALKYIEEHPEIKMRKREAIQPRKLYRAEVDVFLFTADSNAYPLTRGCAGSAGVKERGERTR